MTRLEEVEKFQKDKPKSKRLIPMVKTCSLHVAAAENQLQVQIARNEISKATHKNDSILKELNRTYQEINRLERGYASNLKRDLEEERRKALERQEEARKRFQTLQSDLINVKKDARGIILSMSDILFDIGKATLTQNLQTNLAKIAGILFVYKEANVIVEGHTDNTGSEAFNQSLSEKRAENVMQYLVIQGIPQSRLKAVGYGLTKPVADNATREGRQKNRRVDLVITDPETLSRPQ
jgi:outer membrane protein OmpA-like peptidoglycan-associated protein